MPRNATPTENWHASSSCGACPGCRTKLACLRVAIFSAPLRGGSGARAWPWAWFESESESESESKSACEDILARMLCKQSAGTASSSTFRLVRASYTGLASPAEPTICNCVSAGQDTEAGRLRPVIGLETTCTLERALPLRPNCAMQVDSAAGAPCAAARRGATFCFPWGGTYTVFLGCTLKLNTTGPLPLPPLGLENSMLRESGPEVRGISSNEQLEK